MDVQALRDAFKRKRYGPGEYDPDFDLFDAAADEIERLRAAADPEKITRAVLAVMAKGGDNLAIFNAVKAVCEQSAQKTES